MLQIVYIGYHTSRGKFPGLQIYKYILELILDKIPLQIIPELNFNTIFGN